MQLQQQASPAAEPVDSPYGTISGVPAREYMTSQRRPHDVRPRFVPRSMTVLQRSSSLSLQELPRCSSQRSQPEATRDVTVFCRHAPASQRHCVATCATVGRLHFRSRVRNSAKSTATSKVRKSYLHVQVLASLPIVSPSAKVCFRFSKDDRGFVVSNQAYNNELYMSHAQLVRAPADVTTRVATSQHQQVDVRAAEQPRFVDKLKYFHF